MDTKTYMNKDVDKDKDKDMGMDMGLINYAKILDCPISSCNRESVNLKAHLKTFQYNFLNNLQFS
jgi:hypothetical protein